MSTIQKGKIQRKSRSVRAVRERRTGQRSGGISPGTSHVTPSGRNIFLDLGFPPDEAENLKIRSLMMTALGRIIEDLPQREAALLLGTTQPRVSHLARGRIDLFTIDTLVNMLAHAGARMRISISRPRRRSAA